MTTPSEAYELGFTRGRKAGVFGTLFWVFLVLSVVVGMWR